MGRIKECVEYYNPCDTNRKGEHVRVRRCKRYRVKRWWKWTIREGEGQKCEKENADVPEKELNTATFRARESDL